MTSTDIVRKIPWALIVLRVLGCPLIVLGAMRGWAGGWLGVIVVAALVSDVYDGVLARRWGGETARLRLSDSVADTIFYLGVVWALWLREPSVLRGNWRWLVGLPRWKNDVKTLGRAWELRKMMLAE